MFTSPSTHVAAFSALQTACRRAAEQELRAGRARPVLPRRGTAARLSGALAGIAVAWTLLQTVAAGFAPATDASPLMAAAPATTAAR